MNDAFRNYVFGRSFRIDLSERHVETLASLCKGDAIASYGFGGTQMHGLLRRGLVEHYADDVNHTRYRPTKAGILVYQLLVEAGEYSALEAKRQEVLERESELHRREWEERHANVSVRLKDRYRKDGAEPLLTAPGGVEGSV